jgi:hypothetical protein
MLRWGKYSLGIKKLLKKNFYLLSFNVIFWIFNYFLSSFLFDSTFDIKPLNSDILGSMCGRICLLIGRSQCCKWSNLIVKYSYILIIDILLKGKIFCTKSNLKNKKFWTTFKIHYLRDIILNNSLRSNSKKII